jgi:ABC-type glycerol-3-phosphate transport system permease component
MPRSNLFIYFWLALTAAIIIIPIAYLIYLAWHKSSDFIERKAQVIKENKELKTIKSDLEEQKDEFIATNEY